MTGTNLYHWEPFFQSVIGSHGTETVCHSCATQCVVVCHGCERRFLSDVGGMHGNDTQKCPNGGHAQYLKRS